MIELLSEPKYIALMRNEVKEKGPSESEIVAWMGDASQIRPVWADADSMTTGNQKRGRTQRQTMALRDVRYRLTGRIRPIPSAAKVEGHVYGERFVRRCLRGQQFTQPCFGCREFPAWWGPTTERERWLGDIDAGWMLYDVFDLGLNRQGEPTDKASISLFRAKVEQGIVQVPRYESAEVRKAVRL